MGSVEPEEKTFLVKFDKAISLLWSFSEKSKASFSENVSFLLDKTLDQLRNIANNPGIDKVEATALKDQLFHHLINSRRVQDFLLDTTRVSRALVAHTPVLVFSLNLVGELSNNLSKFEALNSAAPELFQNIQKLVETTVVEHCEVKQAFLQLFSSLSRFKEGQKWLWNSRTFIFIIHCLGDRTIFTRKAAQEIVTFVFPFLDEKQKNDALEHLSEPLFEAAEQHKEELSLIESDKLKPYFEVLQNCVELSLTHNRDDKIGTTLINMNSEKSLNILVLKSGNDKLPVHAGSLLVAIFAKYAAETEGQRIEYQNKTLSLLKLILNRGYLRSALHVLSQSLFYWSNLKLADAFHLQLSRLMIIPVLLHTEEVMGCFPCYPFVSDYWDRVAEESTKAIGQTMVSMLENNTELNELTSIPLSGFHRSMNRLNKEVSLKIFRSCMYLIGCLKIDGGKRTAQLSFTPQLAIHLCKSLCDFITVFNIKWWESYETVCLPIALARLVEYSAKHDVQMTCSGLKGLKFCIEQSVHPDQALLIDQPPDSTFDDIADVLQKCSVSLHWEVRDSALEVVAAMTESSAFKYPQFRKILQRSNLLKAAFSAFNDNEAYVRASAITVVGLASVVPELWQHLTAESDVVSECFKVLQLDSEAIARRASAKALTTVAKSGHFPYGGDRSLLYRNMSSAALSDLDWEVKLQALEFWQVIVDETLTQQGMLDGTFPPFTFSKEKQKIVKLDENEIRRRLEKALEELGSIGCLYVLLHLVDDCDAPVRETALRHIRQLRDLLAKHKSLDISLWPVSSFAPGNVNSVSSNGTASTASPQPESVARKDREQVIEEILSVDDLNLVSDIMVWEDKQVSPNPSPVHLLSPGNFVNQVNMMELETMLHTTELSSDLHVVDFDSLIDDLQDCIHTDPSRPRPDCY